MKTAPILLAALVASTAQAECFMRSTSEGTINGYVTSVSDIRRYVGPGKCAVTFKALSAEGKWHSGSGEYTFPDTMSENDACYYALENGKQELLERLYGKVVKGKEIMVCDETPPPSGKLVEVGQVIKLSDVELNIKKPPFKYKGADCRWFVERAMLSTGEFHTFNGILCKVGRPYIDTWQVMDIF